MLAADRLVAVVSARILTDGAHLSDGTHMSGDEVRDTVLASVGLWRDETGIPIIDCTVCGRRHPETRRHCPICGVASLFSHETHARRGVER